VTGWIPIASMGASHKTGWWQLPDIGIQVLLVFPWGCTGKPVVAGCIYDLKHRPPKHSTVKEN
jgi:phage baseplate assembly protein gpV